MDAAAKLPPGPLDPDLSPINLEYRPIPRKEAWLTAQTQAANPRPPGLWSGGPFEGGRWRWA
jgi:hypothetical protein